MLDIEEKGSFQFLLFVVCRRKVLPNMLPKREVLERYHVICSAHDFWHLCTFSVRDGVKTLNQSRCDTPPFLVSSNVLSGRYFNALKVQKLNVAHVNVLEVNLVTYLLN